MLLGDCWLLADLPMFREGYFAGAAASRCSPRDSRVRTRPETTIYGLYFYVYRVILAHVGNLVLVRFWGRKSPTGQTRASLPTRQSPPERRWERSGISSTTGPLRSCLRPLQPRSANRDLSAPS